MIKKYFTLLLTFFSLHFLYSQDSPWEITPTDCNATVLMPADLDIFFNGVLISESIWVGVTNSDGFVSGSILYTPGVATAIAVWGEEGGAGNGMSSGESFNWIVEYNNIVGVATADFSIEYSCNGLLVIPSPSILDAVSDQDIINGCNDPVACNYNPEATNNDGSCLYPDLNLCQICDGQGGVISQDDDLDGICNEDEIFGCTDSTSCTFSISATEDDGSCQYEDECGVCGGDSSSCVGCTDPLACNYSPGATIDSECIYPDSGFDCDGNAYSCGDVISFMNGPYSFNENNFYISSDTYTWNQSNELAQSYGFYLATINSQEEQDFIESMINSSGNSFWFGLIQDCDGVDVDCEPDDNWGWVTGEIFNYQNWPIPEPNGDFNDGEEDDVALIQFNGGWNDVESSDDFYFIMECGALFVSSGCTDLLACNYNSNAGEDDGSCIYVDGVCETCENGIIVDNDIDDDGICDFDEVLGCTDLTACNYNSVATEDSGSCIYVNSSSICDECSGQTDGTGFIIDNDADNDGLCDNEDPCPNDPDNDTNNNGIFDCEEIVGCTNSLACNYDSLANVDDGSCNLPDGCTNSLACNFNIDALCDDGSCILPDGCTNSNACNYDPDALCDDGSCESLSCVGCVDPFACNYCPECTISLSASCDFNTCCNDPSATNYDVNCSCIDNTTCFNIPSGCDFNCFNPGEGIYPIPITSSYGAYEISCFGASDGIIEIDFNTMNLVSSGEGPYEIQVYQQIDANNDGVISADEEVFIATITESGPVLQNLIAGDYVLIAYDVNGCCGQTLISMDQPGENTLSIPDYEPILCPGGETEINFTIEGAVGQFDVFLDDLLYAESVDGGTVTVNSIDSDSDGIPDDFIQLNTSFYFNQNFWPSLYNECNDAVNTIYINIENNDNIEDGDLIGAFYTTGDGTLQCFGYNNYTSSSTGSSLVTIQICEGDDNGFNNGEEVIFLVYDISDGIINEVDVEYEYNNANGVFSDVFTVDPSYNGIWLSSLSIVGESGFVPDFTLIVEEGNYNIEVNRTDSIDSNGDGVLDDLFICNVVDTIITVIDPDEMFVDVDQGGVVCNYLDDNGLIQSTPGGYIQLDNFSGGTPPYNFTWYNPNLEIIEQSFTFGVETVDDFDGDGVLDDLDFVSTGVYTLDVVDANGCYFNLQVDVQGSDIQLSELDIDFDLIACSGGSTSVNFSLSNNENSPYDLTWSNNSGNILDFTSSFDGVYVINNVEEGSYIATVTDSDGCSIVQNINIGVDPLGQIAIYNPFIETLCDADEAFVSFLDCPTIDGSCVANGNSPFSYTWYLMEDLDGDGVFENSIDLGYPETTASATLEFGTYTFSVVDSNGCSGQTMFTINPPEPIEFSPTIDPILCYGDSATISLEIVTGNPGVYNFVFQGDTTISTIGGSSELDFYIDEETGQFDNSFVTDVNSTLLFNDVSIFSINDTIGVFYTGDNGITCGGSAVYQGESVFSLAVWGDDSSTTDDDGFDSGENILILLNSAGVVYEINVLSFNNLFDSPYSYSPNALSAITDLEIGSEYTQGANFITDPLIAGSYFIEVYDGNNCFWSSVVEVEGVDEYYLDYSISNPSCDSGGFGQISVDVFGGSLIGGLGYQFLWTSPDIIDFSSFGFGFSTILNDLEPATYNLIVLDDNECVLSESFVINFDTPEPEIYITDELCGEDGSVLVCVDWSGDIVFSLFGLGFNESVNLVNDGVESLCYEFNNLPASDDVYNLFVSSDNLDGNGCEYVQSDIFIDNAESIAVEFFTSGAECNNGTGSVWITLLEGGNPPYEIDWQGLDTDATPVGFHEFIITDDNGCEYIQPYVIQNTTSINVDFNVVDNECFEGDDGALSFSINGGQGDYEYNVYNSLEENVLSGSGSTGNLDNLFSGVYTLVVVDANECEVSYSQEIIDINDEINFDIIENIPALCYGEDGSIFVNIENQDNSNFLYHWYQLSGPDWDVDNDGILNSEDYSLDGGVFIGGEVGFSDEVNLSPSYYYVFVESILNSCISDTLLFNIETPLLFTITMDDIYVSCNGDLATPVPLVYGGSDSDIDGDGILNIDEFGNWLDPDIDGDGVYDLDGDCLSNCNDDDIDVDNDNILNENDDYIGGTTFNGISTNSSSSFSNGLIYENELGVEVEPNNLSAGTYYIYAYDSNGCLSVVEEFSIIEPDPLDVSMFYDYNAEGFITDIVGPIEILCYGDSISVIADPFGGSGDYVITCLDAFNNSFNIEEEMLSSGDYILNVTDEEGCEVSFSFSITSEPGELILDADTDNDGVDGILQYNDFHISCNGYSDGAVEFLIPSDAGVSPYSINVFYDGLVVENYTDVFSDNIIVLDNLFAGIYYFVVTDSNGCVLEDSVELVEPNVFSPEVEYVINASCDEETDGMIIIRTSGGNPPFDYTFNNSSEIFTTYDSLMIIEEDNYYEEILITVSDIVVDNLDGNSWHTISILNDDYSCLDNFSPIGFSIYVGSNDDNCLFIPSVFTPNSDGINDTWQIDGIDLYPNASITVFNRWGQIVFESLEGEYVPWDGVSQVSLNDQEIATYYYVIDLNIDNKNYNGSVTIKR